MVNKDIARVCVCVFSLSNLESLELRENLIKYLPASLSCLVKLKTLDLGSNLIDELVTLRHSSLSFRLKVCFCAVLNVLWRL